MRQKQTLVVTLCFYLHCFVDVIPSSSPPFHAEAVAAAVGSMSMES